MFSLLLHKYLCNTHKTKNIYCLALIEVCEFPGQVIGKRASGLGISEGGCAETPGQWFPICVLCGNMLRGGKDFVVMCVC